MSTLTTYYHLIKPAITDQVSQSISIDIPASFNIVDAQLKVAADHIASTSAHSAQHITYSGGVIGTSEVKDALDQLQLEIDVITGYPGGPITKENITGLKLTDSPQFTGIKINNTNAFAWNTEYQAVEWKYSNIYASNASPNIIFNSNGYYKTDNKYYYTYNGAAIKLTLSGGALYVTTAPAGTSGNEITYTNRLIFNNDSVVTTFSSTGMSIASGTYQINGTALAKANITGITNTDDVTFASVLTARTYNTADLGTYIGLVSTPVITHNAAASKYVSLLKCDLRGYTQSANNTGELYGVNLNTNLTLTSGTLTTLYNQCNVHGIASGSGTITNCYGYQSYLTRDAGTITNYYGLALNESAGAGTVTNMWGIYAPSANMKHKIVGNTTFASASSGYVSIGDGLSSGSGYGSLLLLETNPTGSYGASQYFCYDDGAAQKSFRVRSAYSSDGLSKSFQIAYATNTVVYGANPNTNTYSVGLSMSDIGNIKITGAMLLSSAALETSQAGGLNIKTGTLPGSYTQDQISICSGDVNGAGTAGLCLGTEVAMIAETDESKMSHKLPILHNGTLYYLMACVT